MKNVLLAGLTDQEAAAIEIMIGMTWRDARCVVLRRNMSLAIPEMTVSARACTHCVVDLFGLGMRKYSPDNATRLLEFLGGRPAVVLAWGTGGGGWMDQTLPLEEGQVLEWVHMPYSSQDMRAALAKVREAVPVTLRRRHTGGTGAPPTLAGPEAAAPPPAPVKESTLWPGVNWMARRSSPSPVPAPEPAPDPASVEAGVGLLHGAYPALLRAFPSLTEHSLFALIRRVVEADEPQMLTLGMDTVFVVNVRQGWLATSLPVSTLQKIMNTPEMLIKVSITPLTPDTAEIELRQRFGVKFRQSQRPLDWLIWLLATEALKHYLPIAESDVRIKLRRFPNFTMLPESSAFDIQMAAICCRVPQSLQELRRAFPRQDPVAIARFVILSVVSGCAVVLSDTAASAPAARPGAAMPAKPAPTAARKGFFKSLLEKLF
ncbi:hypothetical protein EII20_02285 [Comamonadaceae bacterium OH2545_COT-014]|nr:hypothetical protein EII20_02285 [Comamonadaceae bacterium OH2545_COT-014]